MPEFICRECKTTAMVSLNRRGNMNITPSLKMMSVCEHKRTSNGPGDCPHLVSYVENLERQHRRR